MVLKIDGRTARGKILKDLSLCGKPLKQGVLQCKKICTHCNNTPEDEEIIECMDCHHSFHVSCLLKPLPNATMDAIAVNPSLWWFCLGCVSCKRGEGNNNLNVDTEISIPSDVVLQSSLITFKKDILKLVGETMDAKFKGISDLLEKSVPKESDQILVPKENDQIPVQAASCLANENHRVQSYAHACIDSRGADNKENTESYPIMEKKKKSEEHVLLIERSDKESAALDNGKDIMSSINSALSGINVNFCSVKKSGIIAMGFSDSQSKQLAQDKLKNDQTCGTAVTTRCPEKLSPKVTINGINEVLFDSCDTTDKDAMKNALLNDILARNPTVKSVIDSSTNDFIKVVMLQKSMPSLNTVLYTAALKLSSNVRRVIHENNDKLYISLNRCNVYDRFHVVQCYHCQEPGHVSKNCPEKKEGLSSTCFLLCW